LVDSYFKKSKKKKNQYDAKQEAEAAYQAKQKILKERDEALAKKQSF